MVEGISFHVGSQCTNAQNYIQALQLGGGHFRRGQDQGIELKLLDIGGGFPAHYDDTVPAFRILARTITKELDRLFPQPIEILAEPGRFLVASAATSVSQIIGKAVRDGKLCYYLNDGVYHTYSGVIFDHCQYRSRVSETVPSRSARCSGRHATRSTRSVWPSNCQTWSWENLVYSENIGAYSAASSTYFNGFPPAKIVHVNQ